MAIYRGYVKNHLTVFLGHFCDWGFWGYPANPLIIKQKISNT
jgi:hypothetical protein